MPLPSLLDRIERYYDTAPRIGAEVENIGPLSLFVSRGAWPYYARPRLFFSEPPIARDIELVRRRQRELGAPEAFEWVHETTPAMIDAARAAGLSIRELPLMVLDTLGAALPPEGIELRLLGTEDPGLRLAQAVAHIGFAAPGTERGDTGIFARDMRASELPVAEMDHLCDRLDRGLTRMVAAIASPGSPLGEGPLSVGSHIPIGNVSEIVGVATLPSARHRGLARAVTSRLAEDARARGVEWIFLSAGSEAVARMYRSIGFETIGTACIAEPPER